MNKINLMCIFGGRSSEHEVSLCSAYGILKNTDISKYNIYKVGITKQGEWFVFEGDNESMKNGSWINQKNKLHPCTLIPDSKLYYTDTGKSVIIDVCFPAVHGGYCEDGRLQGLLDMVKIKYVGPGCTSSALCMDKAFTKAVLERRSIPMAKYLVINKYETTPKASDAVKALGLPLFIKPANAGSSVGASKVTHIEEFDKALENAFLQDNKILIEEYIKGKEIEVAVMGRENDIIVSMPGEIEPCADFYDYDTKYKNDTAKYYIPARLSDDVSNKVQNFAKIIYQSLDCKGLSRVDFFVTEQEQIIFNEINTFLLKAT